MNKTASFFLYFLPLFVQAQCDSLKRYEIPPLFTVYENLPEFPGGDKARIEYFSQNIKFPPKWPKDSINGKVYVSFLIDKQGKIKYPCILKSLDPILDSIVIESIIKMPKWIPAMQRGKPLECVYNLPINFGIKKKRKR
jgi:protein TonB